MLIKTFEQYEKAAVEYIQDGYYNLEAADEPDLKNVKNTKWGYVFWNDEEGSAKMGTHLTMGIGVLKTVPKDIRAKYFISERGRLGLIDRWKEMAKNG